MVQLGSQGELGSRKTCPYLSRLGSSRGSGRQGLWSCRFWTGVVSPSVGYAWLQYLDSAALRRLSESLQVLLCRRPSRWSG